MMGANQFGYRYDPIGNRIASTNNAEAFSYAANALNQYTSIVDGGTVTPAYDDDGNMTAYGPWAYTWDGENRLLDVTSNSVAVAANAYDFASRRVAKTANGITRAFVYDGWNLIRETAGTNTTHYVWGLDLSQSLQGAGGVGGLLAVVRDGVAYYPAYDANGNVTEYVSANGTTVAHYGYDPFGNTTAATGSMANDFAHRFSTKYWDPETAMYYYGLRYYSPGLGRWPSRDPIGEQGGVNLQGFCENAAVLMIDPVGTTTSFQLVGDPNGARNGCDKGAYVGVWMRIDGDFAVYSLKYLWRTQSCEQDDIWDEGKSGPIYAYDKAGHRSGTSYTGDWPTDSQSTANYINPINTGDAASKGLGDISYFGENGPMGCSRGQIVVVMQWRSYLGSLDLITGDKTWPVRNPEDPSWHEKLKGWPVPIRRRPRSARLKDSGLIQITLDWDCCGKDGKVEVSTDPQLHAGPQRLGK